ncbi:MAG TPA: carboxypeptidase-like regulatory domain-containing protein [Gemmatimonadaceae bacterium]
MKPPFHQGCRMARMLVLALGTAALPLWLQAQSPRLARVSGRVTDRTTGAPVSHAELLVIQDGRLVTADSVGQYALNELTPGDAHLRVRAPRFQTMEVVVALRAGDDIDLRIILDSTRSGAAQALAGVSVTAPAPLAVSYRLVDFERRRRTGMGQYMTEEEIRGSGAASLPDATRGMRGITVHCGGTESGGCRIQVARAPINCQPEYLVDGRVDNVFGPLTPIRDIIGLEIYTGASDVPGEFAGTRAGCGVVVIWTPSGPSKRSR